MIYKDKTDFTSELISAPGDGTLQVHVTGPGPVSIEFQGDDGVFRSFPESTFTGPTARYIQMPPCQFRVVVKGGPTTVEVFK